MLGRPRRSSIAQRPNWPFLTPAWVVAVYAGFRLLSGYGESSATSAAGLSASTPNAYHGPVAIRPYRERAHGHELPGSEEELLRQFESTDRWILGGRAASESEEQQFSLEEVGVIVVELPAPLQR